MIIFLCSYLSKSYDENWDNKITGRYPHNPPRPQPRGDGNGGQSAGGNNTPITGSSASGLGNCQTDGKHLHHFCKQNLTYKTCQFASVSNYRAAEYSFVFINSMDTTGMIVQIVFLMYI